MASVFRKKGRKHYTVAWFDASGKRRERTTKTSDRASATKIADAIQDRMNRRREGFTSDRSDGILAASRRPIGEHLDEFIASILAGGVAERHGELLRARVSKVIALSKAQTIGDLSGSAVMGAIAALRRMDGLKVDGRTRRVSQKTASYYLRDCKQFARWLLRDGRAADNALAYLTMTGDTENRRKRRALASDELALLIAHAEASGPSLGVPGKDRAMFYRLAAGTGFRRNELATLTPEAFDLDGDPPTVTIEAGYSKHRRRDVQPIRADLAGLLADWLEGKPAGVPVFDLPCKPMELIARDLGAARASWVKAPAAYSEQVARKRSDFLAFKDAAGRYADLHALRHLYVSTLANANVPVKAVQELARHSDPRLTLGVYTHARIHDLAGALEALPSVKPTDAPERQAASATGTDNTTADRQQDRQQKRQQSVCETTPGGHTSPATICETTGKWDSEETAPSPANLRFPANPCEPLHHRGRRGSNPQPPDRQSGTLTN
jgi:integrase